MTRATGSGSDVSDMQGLEFAVWVVTIGILVGLLLWFMLKANR